LPFEWEERGGEEMSSNSALPESWPDKEGSLWERNPETGHFKIVSLNGAPIHEKLSSGEIAAMLGCPKGMDAVDCDVGADAAWFPPSFKYSPNTGKRLTFDNPTSGSWLPPFGNQGLTSGIIQGARVTNTPLRINVSAVETRPDIELLMPPPGDYKFCVGAFGLKASFLFALEIAQGIIYCYLPSRQDWVEIRPSENSSIGIGDFTSSSNAWGIVSGDILVSDTVFWPTDRGLVSVKIDLARMSYIASVIVEGRCLASPALISGRIFALIANDEGIHVASVPIASSQQDRAAQEFKLNVQDTDDWQSPFVTSREAFWFSKIGQVIVRAGRPEFVPWPVDVIPRFELGGIHASSDGKFWQPCECKDQDGETVFAYLQVGRPKPETRSGTPRTLTGLSSIRLESWLTGDPWIEPDIFPGGDHEQDEAVIPIVESITSKSLLCFRVKYLGNLGDFFDNESALLNTTFQIMPQHDERGFYATKLAAPWRTRPFVYDGALFLYHPSMRAILGWKLQSQSALP